MCRAILVRAKRSALPVVCAAMLVAAAGQSAQGVESTESSAGEVDSEILAVDQVLDGSIFPGLSNRISLDLRGMDVLEVLKFLATKGEFNLVTGSEVQGRVTLVLSDVTVRDALDIVLISNGLAIEQRGEILYVMSEQAYEALYGRRYTDPRRSFTTELLYANASQVGSLLSSIKSPVGRIVIDETTATLSILEIPEVLEQMQELIKRVDIPSIGRQLPTETKVFQLHFATADEIRADIESALTPEIGELRVDVRSNSLIITDLPVRFSKIASLIEAFDARHRQVFIESTILQVTLNDNFDTGIDWEWLSESKGDKLADVNVITSFPISSAAISPTQAIVGSIADDDVIVTFKLLQEFGDTEVLSSPHIAAMNNQEAKILVGTRQPYISSATTVTTGGETTAESVSFIDVGIQLYVTPTISDNGYITMKIRAEDSSAPDSLETSSGNTIPIVTTSEAETYVMVKDGTTIVIGGLMKDTTALSSKKIPILGDLPILGALFSNHSDRIQKTEMVILLTPHIISGDEFFVPATAVSAAWPAMQAQND